MRPALIGAAAITLTLSLALLDGCAPRTTDDSPGANSNSSSVDSSDHWQQCADQWHTVAADEAAALQTEHEAFGHMKDAVTDLYNSDVATATDDVNAASASLDDVTGQADAITAETPDDCD